jgi:phosphate transport system substrate-binding protein
MKRGRAILTVLGLLALGRAEEAQPLRPYEPPANATQTIRIWGDRHLDGLARAWARAYQTTHPEISFEINLLGNGTGMPALYLGRADLAFFGRDLIVTDQDGFNHVMKYDPLRIELGTGSLASPGKAAALALFVHRDNPLSRLTLAQVDAIFSARRRRGAPAALRTWGDLGLTGEWAGQPIHLYADDTQSMAGLFFQRVALGDSRMMNWEHFREFPDIRHSDGITTEAAEQSMAALRGDRYGLAVSTLHYVDAQTKVIALAADAGREFITPSADTLVSRRYPLTRSIFACANQPPGRPLDPKVRGFLRFIVGPEGQGILAADGAYLPLAAEMARQELAKLP